MTELLALPALIGESPAIQQARDLLERFAPTSIPIVLVGATGTGKDLLARYIHAQSGRTGPFLPVNCSALPREMAESLLFGHRRGAFSGAIESRRGYLEVAHGGTLFLDELTCLGLEGQAKLLRALDTGEVHPLGEEGARALDVRAVAAVQETLPKALVSGGLRPDLYQRLAGVVISLPPLAERAQDILLLARHFAGCQRRILEPGAERLLMMYEWPGNVRELRHVMERAGRLVANGSLPAAAVAEAIHLGALVPQDSDDDRGGPSERARLLLECERCGWNADRVARALGVHRATLFRKLKRAGLSLRRAQKSQSRKESRDGGQLCDSCRGPSAV